ncbi:hypothetical protein [Absidia glauca]|uniref:Uncharacterized protein n=1 Tax=Absidia glauca TaxID=4829 RepID=A0A168SAJ0_ABSGL|nr:hypothetical protein [Absidia glauca]
MNFFLDQVNGYQRRYASMNTLPPPCGQINAMVTLVYQTFIAIVNILILSGLSMLQELSMNHESNRHHDIEQCTLYMDSAKPTDVLVQSDPCQSRPWHNKTLPLKTTVSQTDPIKSIITPTAICQNNKSLTISNSGTNKVTTDPHIPPPTKEPPSSPAMPYISPIPRSYKKSLLLTAPYYPPPSPEYFESKQDDILSDPQQGDCSTSSTSSGPFQPIVQQAPSWKEEPSIQPHLSKVRLRLTKTIRSWDGTLEQNPFWHEIYNPGSNW